MGKDLTSQLAAVRRILAGPPSHVHMMGIAGVGMAGVAIQLLQRGFKVTGCDLSTGPVADWLRQRNIPIEFIHSPAHIASDVSWVIRSAAVRETDSEVFFATSKGIPVFPRGVVLPALLDGQRSIAVSGTHGKTTTTAMIAQILRSSGIDASFCIGGEVDALGGVAAVGKDNVIVVEADESDGTVELYEPDIAVITNAEWDHVDYFDSQKALVECLARFARNAKKRVVVCADDTGGKAIAAQIPNCVTYGTSGDVSYSTLDGVNLPVLGKHNALNALAACAVALEMGIPIEKIRTALQNFHPAKRRFEKIFEGSDITVISDYAHHPTEIRCLVEQAQLLKKKRILAVFQPHRFSRTKMLGPDFPAAFQGIDRLALAPVYAASEKPIAGGTTDDLYQHCVKSGNGYVENAPSLREAWGKIRAQLEPGDLFLVIGAGDVEKIATWAKDELQSGIPLIK